MTPKPSPRPLEGIRVLDLTRVFSGPLCGRMLADLGADVIKIEAPEGDIVRTTPPQTKTIASMYAHMNAGKRNLCIDLKHPEGPPLVERLVLQSDVLLENFRPGVMNRLGLGAEALLRIHPGLVYCSVTGWGQSGPRSNRKSYAPLIHAEVGTLDLAAKLRGTNPTSEVHQHGDLYAGTVATSAVLAALLQRDRTGMGQHLDVSMAEALLYTNEHASLEVAGYAGPRGFDTWTFGIFELGNGRRVTILGNPIALFPIFAEALGAEHLAADPRFARPELRERNLDELLEALRREVATYPDFESLENALSAYPLMVSELQSVQETAESEWAEGRGLFTEVVPGLRIPRAPFQASAATIGTTGRTPSRGADNGPVLMEVLGLSESAVETLEARRVVLAPDPSKDPASV
ncbi:CoA transferase [Myxococcota bacterium]|nr:CoA transferase [Myxococcota bacterium]